MRKYLRLLQYARGRRASLVWILALSLVGAGLGALQPWPLKLLIDHVLGNIPWPGSLQKVFEALSVEPTKGQLLLFVVLGGLGLFVLNAGLDAILAWKCTVVGRRMTYDLAEELFARLQRRSLLFHSRKAVGDVIGRITVDSWCAYQVVDAVVLTLAHSLLNIAAMILLMSRLDLTLTLIALAAAPLMVGASFLLGKPLRAAAKLRRDLEVRMQGHIQQTLAGIPVVQAFTQEEQETQRLQRFAEAAIRTQQRGALLGSFNNLSSGLMTVLGSGVILWVGARHVLAGSLAIGSIIVFLYYLRLLQGSVKAVGGLWPTLLRLSANADRVLEVLEAPAEIADKPDAVDLPAVRGEVRFESVTAGYESGRPVLDGVSFAVSPGQVVAIVGATGAGKTTLVNLLPRFLDPWEGRVLIDGHDLRDVRLSSLRRQISIVLQESVFFPFSVAENIAFGRPGTTREQIEAAARAAKADGFIASLPDGYETVLGERGATLSGGERQRLAIARAFLKDAPILILDEPTSALDAETERQIMEALQQLMQRRTTFVIAHRLSTIRSADCILVLRDGRVVETGTHDELLVRGGYYAQVHHLQADDGVAVPAATH